MTRPLVLVLYRYWPKSPASMKLYEEMVLRSQAGETKCDYVRDIDSEQGILLENYVNQVLGGRLPDYLLIGLGALQGTLRHPNNAEYMEKEGIKPVMMIGDSSQFMGQHWATVNSNIRWHMLINPNVISPDIPVMGEMVRWRDTHMSQQQAQIKGVPWGVDPVYWKDKGLERDKDVLYMQTTTMTWELHRARIPMYQLVNEMNKRQEISLTTGSINPNNGQWIGMHGLPYRDALMDHKMIICETGMRKIMTAKYVEAAHAGCLIVGEKPGGHDDIFEDGVTFAEIDMDNLQASLRSKILYYKKHAKERQDIVDEMKGRMKEFTTDRMLQSFDDIFYEDYIPRDLSRWTCLSCGKEGAYEGGMWLDSVKKEGRICEECRQKWIRKSLIN